MDEKLKEIVKITDIIEPDLENHKEYQKRYEVYTRLYKALKNEFFEIASSPNSNLPHKHDSA